jgi:DNA-binding GntR family transcriptional regulator
MGKTPKSKQTISIKDIREACDDLAWENAVEIPALMSAIIGVCLKRKGIHGKQLGIAAGTLQPFHHPPAGTRMVKLRTLLPAVLAINATPKDFEDFGLNDEAFDAISHLLDEVLDRFQIKGYQQHGFHKLRFENGGNWQEIETAARERIVHVEGVSLQGPAPFEPRPAKLAILDLIARGELLPDEQISLQEVQEQIASRFPTITITQIDHLLDCIAQHGLVDCRNRVYFVRRVAPDFWRKITEYRKHIEGLNIRYLLDNQEACGRTVGSAGDWIAAMRSALEQKDVAAFFHADIRFHQALASDFTPAYESLSSLLYFIRNAAPFLNTAETMQRLFDDHQQIYGCVAKAANENLPQHERERLKDEAYKLIVMHLDNASSLFRNSA